MEIIIICLLLLFIAGVGATIIYDKMKANGKSLLDCLPRVEDQGAELLSAFKKQISREPKTRFTVQKKKPAIRPIPDTHSEIERVQKEAEEAIARAKKSLKKL